MSDFIPVNLPLLNGNEKKYLIDCVDTGWISSEGAYVKEFETKFANRMGRKYGIAVTNGTAALDVAIDILGLSSGDEVILPTFTIISCIHQILRVGAKPVFVDCDPYTWNIKTDKLEEKITSKTKAIMVVHIYGLPVDMDPVIDLCKTYNLKLIEDAAEVIGQNYHEKPCGSFGNVSTFSFYPNKHVTTGEGGMILTDCPDLADRARSVRNLCFEEGRRFVHNRVGWNLRMTNLQAALGLAQLEQLDDFIVKKRNIGLKYSKILKDVAGLRLPIESTEYSENIYWVFGIVLEECIQMDACEAMSKLHDLGVGCRPFFYPLHLQPLLSSFGIKINETLPSSEYISTNGFYIPSGLALKDEEIERVASALIKILN